MIRIGMIGKTNTGKNDFLQCSYSNASRGLHLPLHKEATQHRDSHVQTICVCKELGVKDRPISSRCIDGWRFIPVELVDLPGLIKGSWKGRGLGTAIEAEKLG